MDGCGTVDQVAQDVYEVKVASEPVVVVAVHQVSGVPSRCASLTAGSGWYTMTGMDWGIRLRSIL